MFATLMHNARKRRTITWLILMSDVGIRDSNSSKIPSDRMTYIRRCNYCGQSSEYPSIRNLNGIEIDDKHDIDMTCLSKVLDQYSRLTEIVDILLTVRYREDDGVLSSFPYELRQIIVQNLLDLYYSKVQ